MKRTMLCLLCSIVMPLFAFAQLGNKVEQVEIRDSNNDPIRIPRLGEKALLIFYVDPDKVTQNSAFSDYLEEHHINSENIYSFGVVNLKDAPLLPNAIVRSMLRRKERKTGATIYTDPDHLLRDAWNLGDVNDQFVTMIISPDKKITFIKKGKMDNNDIAEFWRVIDLYR